MPACLVFITISPALINEARTAQLHYEKYTQELNQSTADSDLWLEARIKQDFFFCREINQIKSKRFFPELDGHITSQHKLHSTHKLHKNLLFTKLNLANSLEKAGAVFSATVQYCQDWIL